MLTWIERRNLNKEGIVNIRHALPHTICQLLMGSALLTSCTQVFAWGDEGHEIVGLIAAHFLTPEVKQQVDAMLGADTDGLTTHDVAAEATWADKFRDSDRNTTKVHYNQTHNWHFVDIELAQPDLDSACNGHPPVPSGTPASLGPEVDCVVDKIDEFAAELQAGNTSPAERLAALKFLLHFVGDIHQPLHASDDHDQGGNAKRVSAKGFKAGNLHHFWDTEFVQQLGTDPQTVANQLIGRISNADATQWSAGTPSDWALESFQVAKTGVSGTLPAPTTTGSYRLPTTYVKAADQTVATQLSKAGVRLAAVLNKAFSGAGTDRAAQ